MAGYGNRKLFLVLLVLFLGSKVHAKHGPKYLTLYAHESFVPPTSTLILSASPDGNLSAPDQFGTIRTLSNVLRASSAIDSTILGSQVGILVIGKDLSVYFSFTYFLNANATHQGTIAVHGHIDGTSTADRVVAVVGGTGDFFAVIGDDIFAADAVNPPDPAHIVNIHTLNLLYLSD